MRVLLSQRPHAYERAHLSSPKTCGNFGDGHGSASAGLHFGESNSVSATSKAENDLQK